MGKKAIMDIKTIVQYVRWLGGSWGAGCWDTASIVPIYKGKGSKEMHRNY